MSDITLSGTVEPPFTVELSQSTSTGAVSGSFPLASTGQPAKQGTSITGTVSGSSITFSFTDNNNLTDVYTGTISSSGIQITNGTYSINGAATGKWTAAWSSSS